MTRRLEVVESIEGIDEIRVTRYRCEGCHVSYSSKPQAKKHVGICWKYIGNRGCGSCAHAVRVDVPAQSPVEPGVRMVRKETFCNKDLQPVRSVDGRLVMTIGCPAWMHFDDDGDGAA